MREVTDRIAHVSGDHLIDLARGLVDRDRRAADLAHLRACEACERRFRDVCRESEILDLERTVGARAEPRPRRWRVAWVVSAAAAAALAFVAVFQLTGGGPTDHLDYRLPVQAEPLILRSLPDRADTASLLAAVEAYGRDDFRRVTQLLDGRELHDELDFLNLFHASALVWTGRDADAETVLGRLNIETLPLPYRDRARRILYVALRRGGKNAEADRIVRELAEEEGGGEFGGWARDELTHVRARPSE